MRNNKPGTYVIAEVGINHNGSLDKALFLISKAVEAGADAVKFQTFKTEKLVRRDEPKMQYQAKTARDSQKQFDMLKKVELDKKQHIKLIKCCRERGIDFISTPYDQESADLLLELKVDAIKIASTDTTNIPFLRYVAKFGLPIIYSTGASQMWEIVLAISGAFSGFPLEKLTILHCVSNYPAPLKELNLRCLKQLHQLFGCRIGFSDHSSSLLTGAYAVCAGADVIEKHITFDNKAPGPDHRASLETKEFLRYVRYIREADNVLGDGIKKIQASERKIKKQMQKSLVASRMIPAGTTISTHLLSAMRPGEGISPLFFDDLIGKKLIRDKEENEVIKWEDLRNE